VRVIATIDSESGCEFAGDDLATFIFEKWLATFFDW
jgi:hypothetical protein